MQGLVRLQVLPTGGGKSKGTVRGYGDAAAAKDRGGMGLDWVQLELELALALDFTLHMMVLRGLGRRIRSDPCVARGQRSAFFAALPRDGCRVVTLSIIVMAKAHGRLRVAIRVAPGRWTGGHGRVGRRIVCGWAAVDQPPQARHLANLAIIRPTRPAQPTHARNQGATL
jgi:hypothetical protein